MSRRAVAVALVAVLVAFGLWAELHDRDSDLRPSAVFASLWAAGQFSTNYRITADAVSSGGGSASSLNYSLIDSVGLPAGVSSGLNYTVSGGFVQQLLETTDTPTPTV